MTGKSFHRICDPGGRGIKAGETEESLGRSTCLGRPGTVSSNSNLRIAYDTLTSSAFDEISLNPSLAVINIKGIFYAIIGPSKTISDSFEDR
jgi:hypothetical protein